MDTWQDLIYKEHRKNLGMNQYSAERAYLDIASKQPLYGATLWRVKVGNSLVPMSSVDSVPLHLWKPCRRLIVDFEAPRLSSLSLTLTADQRTGHEVA